MGDFISHHYNFGISNECESAKAADTAQNTTLKKT